MPETNSRLPREFFMTDALTLSQALIGKIMVHRTPYGLVRGIITETEAYMGVEDKGSHTYGGRRTDRTEPMFHIGGTSYVYFIYGMYNCMNITAGEVDIPQASLIRAVEPADEESMEIMQRFRMEKQSGKQSEKSPAERSCKWTEKCPAEQSCKWTEKSSPKQNDEEKQQQEKQQPDRNRKLPVSIRKHLSDGPGKLCIAMNITKKDNDVDMAESEDFYLTEGIEVLPSQIQTGKRIGIDYAEEAADYLWRFTLRRD